MGKTAACTFAVLLLLAGAACPLAAAQGGPPEHANDDGAGPPDRGEGGGSGDADEPGGGDAEPSDSDDDGEDDEEEAEADDEGDGSEGDDDGDESDDREGENGGEAADGDGGGEDGGGGEGNNAPSSDSDSDSQSESKSASDSDSDSEESVLPFLDALVEDPDGGSNSTSGEADDATPESTPSDTPTEAVETETRAEPTATREATARPTATARETPTATPESADTPTPTYEPLVPNPRSDGETTPGANESTPTTSSATPAEESSPDDDGDADATDGSTSIDPGPVVDQETVDNSTTASVSGVDRDERIAVDLRGPADDGEGVDVRSVTVGGDGPFELAVSRPTTDAPDEPVPGVSLAYFDVESSDEPVSNGTLTVEVPPERLPSGVGPDDVEVLRYDGGEWTTTGTDAGDREATYVADVRGFSSFAVALPDRRPLSVTDAALQADWVRTGHEVTASAVVSNPVDRPASERLTVALDGEPVATRNVTLDGGEETRLQVDVPAASPGNRTVAIGGAEAGQLRVADESTSTPAAGGGSDFGFGVAAAAVVVLGALATGFLVVRNEAWDRGD